MTQVSEHISEGLFSLGQGCVCMCGYVHICEYVCVCVINLTGGDISRTWALDYVERKRLGWTPAFIALSLLSEGCKATGWLL